MGAVASLDVIIRLVADQAGAKLTEQQIADLKKNIGALGEEGKEGGRKMGEGIGHANQELREGGRLAHTLEMAMQRGLNPMQAVHLVRELGRVNSQFGSMISSLGGTGMLAGIGIALAVGGAAWQHYSEKAKKEMEEVKTAMDKHAEDVKEQSKKIRAALMESRGLAEEDAAEQAKKEAEDLTSSTSSMAKKQLEAFRKEVILGLTQSNAYSTKTIESMTAGKSLSELRGVAGKAYGEDAGGRLRGKGVEEIYKRAQDADQAAADAARQEEKTKKLQDDKIVGLKIVKKLTEDIAELKLREKEDLSTIKRDYGADDTALKMQEAIIKAAAISAIGSLQQQAAVGLFGVNQPAKAEEILRQGITGQREGIIAGRDIGSQFGYIGEIKDQLDAKEAELNKLRADVFTMLYGKVKATDEQIAATNSQIQRLQSVVSQHRAAIGGS